MTDVAPKLVQTSLTNFNRKEFRVMIEEAHSRGVKVATHAFDWARVQDLDVDTVEHGAESLPLYPETASQDEIRELWRHYGLKNPQTTWVPTLAAHYEVAPYLWPRAKATFRAALAAGFENIACGGDTGAFTHGENARELQLMVALGAPWQKVLSWATFGGWKTIRPCTWEGEAGKERLKRISSLSEDPRKVGDNEVAFGVVRRGFVADIIATTGDLNNNFNEAVSKEKIVFVMKGGRVYKREGKEVARY